MGNYRFLLFYSIVFLLTYQGLMDGGTGNRFVDIILINIFFIFCYVNIYSLKVYNFTENKIIIPIILFSSYLYFYKVDYYYLFFYAAITFYLYFIKKYSTGSYNPLKSVIFNFFKNSSKIDIILILGFVILTFLNKR